MRVLIFITLSLISLNSFTQTNLDPVFFIGPMIHYNIGSQENKFSFAIEGSAWAINTNLPVPPSIDLGIEFERKKLRVYSELQTGALLGVSLGPVVEFSENDPVFGFQSSIWASFITGLDLRYRRINRENFYAPGFFVKLPVSMDKLNTGF